MKNKNKHKRILKIMKNENKEGQTHNETNKDVKPDDNKKKKNKIIDIMKTALVYELTKFIASSIFDYIISNFVG